MDISGKSIDLHTHSCASDGSDTPTELLNKAFEIGLGAVALTDHDTVSGIDEFLAAAADVKGIIAVPGVEISTRLYEKELHIVGLFIDHKNEPLLEILADIRSGRESRNRAIITRLNSSGYHITYEELMTEAQGESVGRPHIASLLIKKDYFATPQDVFDRCLRKGTVGYVSRELLTPEEGISAIHNAGGIAIWAHPIYRQQSERNYLKKFLKKLVSAGLDGVEAYYPLFSEDQIVLVKELAAETGLILSGGSDYHGSNQPSLKLGIGTGNLHVPYSVFQQMEEYRRKS